MSLTCPQCDRTLESADDLEAEEIEEITIEEDGSIDVYGGKRTFYRCRECRNAMGVGHS